MTLAIATLVHETAFNPGQGTFELQGAASGRQAFSEIGNGNTTLYFAVGSEGSEWGIGTYSTGSPNTLARTTVIRTSNGDTTKLDFAGTVQVYVDIPDTYRAVITPAGIVGHKLPVLIEAQTAANDASLDFVTGIDATYDAYLFVLTNIAPATDNDDLQLLVDSDGGASFETSGYQYHGRSYSASLDAPAISRSETGTRFAITGGSVGSAAGEAVSGTIFVHDPADATEPVKVDSALTYATGAGVMQAHRMAGLAIAAVDAFQFKFGTGNIASGAIALYGLKT